MVKIPPPNNVSNDADNVASSIIQPATPISIKNKDLGMKNASQPAIPRLVSFY